MNKVVSTLTTNVTDWCGLCSRFTVWLPVPIYHGGDESRCKDCGNNLDWQSYVEQIDLKIYEYRRDKQ
jgi:hypothetical protein|tara:strand:- start:78 stop:281 length:204 start_codon:yes stop_codon:yes gene_type:complete